MVGDLPSQRRHLALILDHLGAGGVQTMALSLGRELVARGHCVDLVVCQTAGPLAARLPHGMRLFELERSNPLTARLAALRADPGGLGAMLRPVLLAPLLPRKMLYTAALASYLRQRKPDGLIAATRIINLIAVWAARLADASVPLLLSERNPPSAKINGSSWWHERHLPQLMARTYRFADAIVAVSDGVADDLAALTGLPRSDITTIYNPVVTRELALKAEAPLAHPWFAAGQHPIVLAAGRLVDQKDYPVLIRAFAELRSRRPARLVILGEATNKDKDRDLRGRLLSLARELGVADAVDLPGYVANPCAYMARAAVLVVSSKFEGFGNVLVEAMACGCPVVSTNCPGGPSEILDRGRFGDLVPVGDFVAMAAAIERTISTPPDAERLRKRAALFTASDAANAYLHALFGKADDHSCSQTGSRVRGEGRLPPGDSGRGRGATDDIAARTGFLGSWTDRRLARSPAGGADARSGS